MMGMPRQLVVRIAVIGLANLVLFFSMVLLTEQGHRRRGTGEPFGPPGSVAGALTNAFGDPAQTQLELDRLERDSELQISIFDAEGKLVARTSKGPALPRGVRPGQEPRRRPLGPVGLNKLGMVMPLGPRGSLGAAVLFHKGEGPTLLDPRILFPGLLALITVISTLLIARWLLRPLLDLSAFARELGSGNLRARLGIDPRAPLGEVGATFNEMAEHLEKLVRAQKELLANVSHELRTPLARIRVAMDLASEGGAEQAATSLREIAEDLGELERLVTDIMTTARLELSPDSAGGPPLREERFEARAVLEDAEGRFRARRPERPLRVVLPAGSAQVIGDRMLLRRALENLLDNAARHSEPAQEVVLTGAVEQQRLTVTVADRGTGMSAAELEKLFTPFFRGDSSRARQTGGLGLGLLLTRRIVEAHGGTLAIQSEPGEGTVVTIRLSLAPALPP